MKTADILKLKTRDSEWSIGHYLQNLLLELLKDPEAFSGKRPFGNSSWEYDLYVPLIKAGLIAGVLDEDDCIEEVDTLAGDKLLQELIKEIFGEY